MVCYAGSMYRYGDFMILKKRKNDNQTTITEDNLFKKWDVTEPDVWSSFQHFIKIITFRLGETTRGFKEGCSIGKKIMAHIT